MGYCSNCGQTLREGAKFCDGCGTPVIAVLQTENTQRKTVYDGKIHKCPNCGEILSSFITSCPSCGYELRDSQASNSVKEFASKLEEIEKTRPQSKLDFFGIKKRVSDQITTNSTDEKKISLIRNFAIPNTKEDLIEFLILASSNIDLRSYNDAMQSVSQSQKAVSDAWEAKFEQAYEKAKMSFGDSSDFKRVQEIYNQKHKQIRKSKKKKIYIIGGIVLGTVLLYVVLFGVINAGIKSDNKKIEAENQRLEATVQEVYEAIEDENYSIAKAKAATVAFSGPSDEDVEKWDKTREKLLEVIDAAENGSPIARPDNNQSEDEQTVTNNATDDISNKTAAQIFTKGVTANSNKYLEVKEATYTLSDNYLTCIVTISNLNSDTAIELPAFRITVYDKSGKILGTEERVLSIIYPNQKFVDAGTLIEVNGKPNKVDITILEPDEDQIKPVSNIEHPTHKQMVGKNISLNSDKITGELFNPNDYKIDSAMVTVIFRDNNGDIVSSEETFIEQIPANGSTPFDIYLSSEMSKSYKTEVYGYIW